MTEVTDEPKEWSTIKKRPSFTYSPAGSALAMDRAAEPLLVEISAFGEANRRRKQFDWRAPTIILGYEFLDSIAFAGIALNLVVYFETVLHGSTAWSAANVDIWTGTTYLVPVVAAFLADTYWGKYKTIFISSILYLIGLLVMTASVVIPALQPCEGTSSCSAAASQVQYSVFFLALYLVGLGTGGVKAALLPFGADQYDDADPEESSKKPGFFSWFFVAVNLGVFIAGTVVVYVQQYVGWAFGFGTALLSVVVASVLFLAGTRIYRVQLPTESPLKSVANVLAAAVRKRRLKVPSHGSLLYEADDDVVGQAKLAHTDGYRCLDKAAIVGAEPRCTVTQVEEVKIILRMIPIWFTCVFLAAALGQTATTFIQQGLLMDTQVGPLTVAPASLNSAEVIFIILLVIIQDKVVVPIARQFTGNPAGLTLLQRMGTGRLLAIPAMATAALIEAWRLRAHKSGDTLSIAWQIPQYVVVACSDVFSGIAQLDFFYSEAPESMRSLCSAFSFLALSLGFYVNSFVISTVAWLTKADGSAGWIPADLNNGHLDYYFWMWTGIAAVNFVAFLAFSVRYTPKKVVLR